jgi:hypothetical protein
MIRKIGFILVFIVLGCNASRKFGDVDFSSRSILYDKVKVKVSTKTLGDLTLRGYINIYRDSFFCFKFYGPLAYELVSGYCKDKFFAYDHFNDVTHTDVLNELSRATGIVFNRNIFEELLAGNLTDLVKEIKDLNGTVLDISTNHLTHSVVFTNTARNSLLSLLVNYRNLIPKEIELKYDGPVDKWTVKIAVLHVSNEQRRCNFE